MITRRSKKAWRDGSRDVFDTKGAFYSAYMRAARENERFSKWLYDPALDIYTFWDIGINDHTAIPIVQFYGKEIRIIDCVRWVDEGLEYYVNLLKQNWYFSGNHYFPHDIQVRELTYNGRSRKEYLESLGIKVNITPNISREDGILAVRTLFNFFWFDEEKTEKLVEALNVYRKKRDENNQVYWDPIHDRSSNFADAIRYMCVNYASISGKKNVTNAEPKKPRVVTDPLTGEQRVFNRGNKSYSTWWS